MSRLFFYLGIVTLLIANTLQVNAHESERELSRLCRMAQIGDGNTIYYSNGKIMTHFAGRTGVPWYYSNGKIMTHFAGRTGVPWYYSNGQVMTHFVGQTGVPWYYPNGQIMTYFAGQSGATYYHSNGQILTHRGNLISEEEILYPCSYIE